ncbi:MAG: hypothetical protein HKN43_06180 [Rhodothermales bacterium]|nr:hypothetical protein [Rhodothermales bacterium]
MQNSITLIVACTAGLFLVVPGIVKAQTGTVAGTVVDADSAETIISARLS